MRISPWCDSSFNTSPSSMNAPISPKPTMPSSPCDRSQDFFRTYRPPRCSVRIAFSEPCEPRSVVRCVNTECCHHSLVNRGRTTRNAIVPRSRSHTNGNSQRVCPATKTHHVSNTGPTNGINTGEAYRSCLHRVTSEAMQVNRLRIGNTSPATSSVVPNICVLFQLTNGSVRRAAANRLDLIQPRGPRL